MELTPLGIEGAWLAASPLWRDERGYFREWFKSRDITKRTGYDFSVAQANISSSSRGTLRGIHYSLADMGQAKWITCVAGSVMDVIVDIRPSSPTFKKWITLELAGSNGCSVLIGDGLGHGFISLQDESTVAYLVTSPFSPSEEFEINPLDPDIGIDWGFPISELRISAKDCAAPFLSDRFNQNKLPK
jgi:dTDP-4-dehydrorhamnose 3,5-epimerase